MDGGVDPNSDMFKQASHMWSMLDEMASSDPAAYSKFIKKTMEDGKEKMKLPKPFVCIKTSLVSPQKSVLFINMCAWEHIPKPGTDTDPISVATGPIEDERDQTGEYCVVRLAFNPYVLEESFKNSVDRDLLINLGMDYVEQQHKVKVSRTSYKEIQGLKFKGNVASLTSSKRFFGKREKTEEEMIQENLAGLSTDSLLGKIHELSGKDLEQSDLESRLRDLAFDSAGSDEKGKKKVGLIEEISSSKVELPRPKCTVDILNANEKKPRRLELRLQLDGVESVAECELDIAEEEVNLFVEGKFELSLPLPEPILESEAKAKFHKKNSLLIVTLPTQAKS